MSRTAITLQGIVLRDHKDETFEGYYKGFRETQHEDYGKGYIYKFEDINGKVFQIYGFTMLDLKMEYVREGDYCWITYTGTQQVKTKAFGTRDVHQVEVEVSDDYEGNGEAPKYKSSSSEVKTATTNSPVADEIRVKMERTVADMKFELLTSKSLDVLLERWSGYKDAIALLPDDLKEEITKAKDDKKERLTGQAAKAGQVDDLPF